MIWKTTPTNIFLPSKQNKSDSQWNHLLGSVKDLYALSHYFLVTGLLFATLSMGAQTSSNITGDDCISFDSCPEDQVVCANETQDGVLGAYIDWQSPLITQTCTNNGNEGNFQMLFELNENLLTQECWYFNYIIRSGGNGGHLKLFSSVDKEGNNESIVTTPYLILNPGSQTSFEIKHASGEYYIQLFLVDESGNEITSSGKVQVTKAQEEYVFNTSNTVTGAYRLKYVFSYVGKEPSNANTGDTLIAVDGILADDACTGGIDFVVTGPEKGFYPVGSHDLEYVATYTSSDGLPKTKTCTFNITVTDLEVGVSEIQPESCSGEADGSFTATATGVNGSGTEPFEYSLDGISYQTDGSFNDLSAGTYQVTVRDATGCTKISEDIIIEVLDDEAPVISAPADSTLEDCDMSVITPAFSETETTITEQQFIDLGGSVSDDGEITSITYEDQLIEEKPATVKRTFTVSDTCGNIGTDVQTIIVQDTTAPEGITIADATGECEVTVTAPVTTDNCAGEITGTTEDPLTYTEQGEYVITWTFDDGNGNITTADQKIIVNDTTAPEIFFIPTVTRECQVVVTPPTTTDNCAGEILGTTEDPLVYTEQGYYEITWTFDDGNGNSATSEQTVIVQDIHSPEQIEIPDAAGECEVTVTAPVTTDNCAGEVTGTTEDPLTYTEQGEYVITWTFDDGNGNSTTETQNVIVNDTTAPEETTVADATGECEVTVTAPVTTDNCAGEVTGTTEDPLTYTEQGEYVITWTFDDGNGNMTTAEQNVIVNDTTAPEGTTVADATGECEVTVTVPVTTDNCAGEVTGTTEDPLTYTEQGEYVITWTFNDGNGNSTTETQNVIVNDTTAPEWTSDLPLDITVECDSIPEATELNAEDDCGVSIEFSEEITTTDCVSNYVITRTWTATDNNANSTSHTQVITVEDTNAPTLEGSIEEEITISCEEIPMAPELTFTDNCSGEVVVEFEEDIVDGENESFVITRTWTATDCPGNEAVFTQVVNVNPTPTEIETSTADICIDDSVFDLSELLLGDYDQSGTWEDPQETGALQNGSIDPSLLAVGEYSFNYVISDEACPSTTTVMVSINDDCVVLPCGAEDIKNSISKTVTPNGDNRNDFFTVGLDVDCGFTYNLKVFNRWGNMVYESNNYQNNWDGSSNKSVSGSRLPSGTYYYILEINQSGFEPIQSYIYLGTK